MSGDVESLKKTVRELLAKLQEAEQRHQSGRVAFEVRCGIWREGALGTGSWMKCQRLSQHGLRFSGWAAAHHAIL